MNEKRPLDSLQVFCGASNHNLAQVYCRLTGETAPGAVLRGTMRGPQSSLTHTLPASVDMEFLGADPQPLARAAVVDPCYWAPGRPYLYHVELELSVDGRLIDHVQRIVGLRTTGVVGSTMRLSFNPWVLCGVRMSHALSCEPARWREMKLAQVWSNITEQTCRTTSEEGIPVMVSLSGNPSTLESTLHRLADWPSVAIVIIDCPDPLDSSLRRAAPNLLLGKWLTADRSFDLPSWAHLGVCDTNVAVNHPQVRDVHFPLILTAVSEHLHDLSDAVSAIDELQRVVDPQQGFAGIIV
jgi:hypothetical protein